MSYARRWWMGRVFSTKAILLESEPSEGSRPMMVFDVSTEGNVNDARVTVYRALHALPPSATNLDRADAVLAALGIVHESAQQVVELRGPTSDPDVLLRSA